MVAATGTETTRDRLPARKAIYRSHRRGYSRALTINAYVPSHKSHRSYSSVKPLKQDSHKE